MEENRIERLVADAILEHPVGELVIEGQTYEIAPPTIATLIMVSEIVASLPPVDKAAEKDIVASVLHHARFYGRLGEMVAVMILGSKNITEERDVTEEIIHPFLFGLCRRRKVVTRRVTIDRKAELAQLINDNLSPSVMLDVIVRRLKDMGISDFFAITTSLSEANLLHPTKEVV